MFASRFFADRFFPNNYFPHDGGQQAALVGVWASVVKVSAAPQEATKLKTTDR